MNIQLDFFCTSNAQSEASPHRILPFDEGQHEGWLPTVRFLENMARQDCRGETDATPDAEATNRVVVLLTDTRHLADTTTLELLVTNGDKSLRYASPGKDERRTDWEEWMCPILTVGVEDFSDLYSEEAGEVKGHRRYLYKIGFDHRVKFWDSSIWHRYIPLNEDFPDRVRTVLRQTARHFENGLYASYASLATLEFQTRAMLQSYICEAGGGHGEVVTPFKFHSEAFMERKAESLLEELKKVGYGEKKLFDTVRWRLLLVDDYAYKPLRSRLGEAAGARMISKRNLIVNLLNEGVSGFSPLKNDAPAEASAGCVFSIADVEEESRSFVEGGLSALRKQMYDVVLLDYLLGEHQGGNRGGREYGYDFLHQLEQKIKKDEHGQPIRKGPLGRFWVFPISSFPFAFSDKLRQLGMDGYTDHWHLSGGGDPITTPALFRFNFFQFVKQQVDECCLSEASMSDFLQRFASIRDKNAWRGALELGLQRIRLNQEMLRSDIENGSAFSETMAEFLVKDAEMSSQMRSLTYFLGQIERISYFDLMAEVLKIPRLTYKQQSELHDKCEQTFFRAERECKEQVDRLLKSNPTVEVFELTDTKLRYLPREIGSLAYITRLRLSNNLIQELPPEIKSLTSLKDLDLAENCFSKLPDELFDLPLWRLNLRDNPSLPEDWQKEHIGTEAIATLKEKVKAANAARQHSVQ